MTHHTIVTDPVCGMRIAASKAVVVRHDGIDYYFCEPACAEIFRNEPERWLDTSDVLDHAHR